MQKISCGSGKTVAACWNTADYLQIFGPSPDGNILPNTNADGNCIWTNRGGEGNVEGCQNESGTCTTDADCGPIGNCVNPFGEPNSGKCPAGTYAGKDKDGNAFTIYYTGQWNNHVFETTCSYSPYKQQVKALGPSC